MKGTFDCHGNLIHEGDIVKCSPGYEETLIPYTERYAGDLIIGEVIKCSQEFVYVLGVQTKKGGGNMESDTIYRLIKLPSRKVPIILLDSIWIPLIKCLG